MDLERVIAALAPRDVVGRAPLDVADLAYDTRAVTPGALFFCVRGTTVDGHDLAADARTPRLRDPRGGRPAARPPRHDRGACRRRAAAGRPDNARGDRPPAHVSRDAGRRRPELRDGSLLARVRPAPPRPRPL